VLPAIGPRWLGLVGFDRALIEAKWLERRAHRLLLLGASVGAWRSLALASRTPMSVHHALVEEYCAQHFTLSDDGQSISRAYRQLITRTFRDADIEWALSHPDLDIVISTVRMRRAPSSGSKWVRGLLAATAVLNLATPRAPAFFFERALFHTSGGRAGTHPALHHLVGLRCELSLRNARDAALASGTVPGYMDPIRDIAGAPPGTYCDGALSDYHSNQPLRTAGGIALLFLHQARIIPSWFDKFAPWRTVPRRFLDDLLLVYPDPEFLRSLPGGVLPTREDFRRFMNEPEQRAARWKEVAARTNELGTMFLHDASSGAVASLAKPF
jgi:hypothetical protein